MGALLPTLNEQASITLNRGAWSAPDGGRNLLDEIVKHMKIIDLENDMPHSTPSVYERPFQFFYVLKNKEIWPDVYCKLVQEWRALISLLALSNAKDLKIKFQRIDLSNPYNQNEFLANCSDTTTTRPSLEASEENANILRGSGWDELFTILLYYEEKNQNIYSDTVVGLTSPYTIFSPSKDFAKIIEVFKWIKFVPFNTIRQAYDNDGLKFGDECNKILASQFITKTESTPFGLTVYEIKGIVEWLQRFKYKYINDNGYLSELHTNLIDSFIFSLNCLLPSEIVKMNWYEINNKFLSNPFFNEQTTSTFKYLNFTLNKNTIIDDRLEKNNWYLLFSLLALKELRKIDIIFNNNNQVVYNGLTVITNLSDHTIITPVSNLSEKVNFKIDELSFFECLSVLNWLERFRKSIGENLDLLERVNSFADLLKEKLKDFGISNYPDVFNRGADNIILWKDNRFIKNAFTQKQDTLLSLFNFTIHAFNASFFEDTVYNSIPNTGIYRSKALRHWFNILEVIALSKIRNIDMKFRLSDVADVNADLNDDLYIVNNELLFRNFSMLLGSSKRIFAQTSRATIIAPFDDNEIRIALFNIYDNMYPWEEQQGAGKRHIRRNSNPNANEHDFIFDHKLYDYEVVALNRWFCCLKDKLKSSKINQFSSDLQKIIDILDEKIAALWTSLETRADVEGVYDFYNSINLPEISSEFERHDTVGNLFNFYAHVDIFADNITLIEMNDDNAYYNNLKNNDGSLANILYDRDNKPLRIILMPFSDNAVEAVYNLPHDKRQSDMAYFNIEYLKSVMYNLSPYIRKTIPESISIYEVSYKHRSIAFPIIKIYRKDEVIEMDIMELPSIYVWPDVEIEDWNSYYLTHELSSTKSDIFDKKIEVKFLNNTNAASHSINIDSESDFEFDVKRFNAFPRMLRFSYTKKGKSYYSYIFAKPENTYKPTEPYIIKDSRASAIIGVDFGTTNTTAYIKYNDGSSAPKKIIIYNTISEIVTRKMPTINRELSIAVTSKLDREMSIFSTSLIKYTREISGNPFIESNIYHMTGLEDSGNKIFDSELLCSNLKWGENNSITEMEAFLKQFAMQCCLMAVKEKAVSGVEFRVSYPTSLNRTKMNDMVIKWGEILHELGGLTGLRIENSIKNECFYYTESYASGKYFREDVSTADAHLNRGFICIDIGGGTTDISVWQSENKNDAISDASKPKAQLSLAFAGRNILIRKTNAKAFIEALKTINDKITERFKNTKNDNDAINIVDSITTVLLKKFNSSWADSDIDKYLFASDLIISNISKRLSLRGETLKTILPDLAKKNSSSGKEKSGNSVLKYLAQIKFSLAGMSYFIGLVIKKLIEKNLFELRDSMGVPYLELYLAGNGSKSLGWLTYNNDNIDVNIFNGSSNAVSNQLLSKFIETALDYSSNSKINIKIVNSKEPKHEAACGLVLADPDDATSALSNTDSVVPVNIDKAVAEYGKNPRELVRHINEQLTQNGYGDRCIDIDMENVNKITQMVTNIINPDFNDEAIKNLIGKFIKTFKKYSPSDFNLLFDGLDVFIDEPIDTNGNNALVRYIAEKIEVLKAPDKNFPIRDFNGYILLKFIYLKLDSKI